MKCLFGCNDHAIARWHLDKGCIARNETVQVLCLHHTLRSQPTGGMELMEDYTEEGIWEVLRHFKTYREKKKELSHSTPVIR